MVTLYADDGTYSVSETITISVPNEDSILDPIGDTELRVGDELIITLDCNDIGGGPVVFSSSTLPPGATLVGDTLTWIPNNTQTGEYSIIFYVDNGTDINSESIVLTINKKISENAEKFLDEKIRELAG